MRERDAGSCEVRNRGRLEEAIVALNAALKEPLTAEQEVRSLAMLMHFLEDAHQPLHSMTLVRNNCKIDAGGNGFCVQKMSSNCVMNLHQLWDSGFSNSKDASLFNQLAIKPASSLPLQTELGLILAENQSHAATIYATDEGRMPHRDYMAAGTDITRSRLDAAVNRIYHLLDKHWRYKTQG